MQPKHYSLDAKPGVVKVSRTGSSTTRRSFSKPLFQTVPRQDRFSPVPYYLICRSLELGLKAFVLAKGDSVACVRSKLKHDLLKGLARAKDLGLVKIISISSDEESELGKANTYYDVPRKGFEYFEVGPAVTGYPGLPNLSTLENLAGRLVTAVSPVCIECA